MKIRYLIDTLLSADIQALDFVGRYGGIVSTIYTNQFDDETKKDNKKRYPVACDVNSVDCENLSIYQDLVPNDDKISVVYWEEVNPMTNVGETATKNFYNRRFRGTARLVFWANLAKLGSSTCNGDMMAMQLELERVITRKGKVVGGLYNDSFIRIQPTKDVQQDINTVFGKYDYPKELNYYLYPFGYFAIDVEFEIDYCIATGANVPVNPAIDCYNDDGTTACEKILALLTDELKLTCVLPTYDFSDAATLAALSAQQNDDLRTHFITNATCLQLSDYLTTSQLLTCVLGFYDFADPATQAALSVQQKSDLTAYLIPIATCLELSTNLTNSQLLTCVLPLYDFSDIATQNALSAQQKEDLKPVIVPLLDYTIGFDDDFNLFSAQQITDLGTRICGIGTQYSLSLDGVNEYLEASQVANQELERNNTFSCSCWVKLNQINKFHALVSKYIAPKGWYMAVDQNDGFAVSLQNNGAANGILVRTNTFSVPQNTWTHLAFTYSGNSLASGIKLYINGALAAKSTTYDTLSATILQPTAKVLYGGIPTAAVYTNSKMFECVLWNVELSGAEVLADYNRDQADNPPQLANIILHNRLGTGSTFGVNVFTMEDVSGNCNGIQSVNMEFADRTTDIPI